MSSKSSLSGALKNSILAVLTVVILHILLKQYYEPFNTQGPVHGDNILDYVYAPKQELYVKDEEREHPPIKTGSSDLSIEEYLNTFATPPNTNMAPTTDITTTHDKKQTNDINAFGGFDTSSSSMFSWWNN
jgi:hypothetical protein